MSKKNLIVFVEGNQNDPYFYASSCSTVFAETGISFKIFDSKEIPTGRGKTALIALFRYLSKTSSLLNDLHGKKTTFLFFLDKDLDDLLKMQIYSEHVIYTYYYDVENHIVEHGDLKKGCAIATSMDPQELDRAFTDQARWLRDAAQKWKDWVIFCAFVQLSKMNNCCVNYSISSKFNDSCTGPVNKTLYDQKLAILKAESGLSESDFAGLFKQVSDIVEEMYQRGEYGKVFKGKWYKYFLAEQVRQTSRVASGDVSGFEQQIFKHIAGTLDFKATWTNYFVEPLKRIVNQINQP